MKKLLLFMISVCFLILLFFMSKEMEEKGRRGQSLKGEPSLKELLNIALQPVGKTMYVWGGGWNEEDNGAGEETRRIGLSPLWEEFAQKQGAFYDYETTRYQIHQGLDCSGYIGWVVYNLLETENEKEGYVTKASQMAKSLADKGLGDYTKNKQVTDWQPGDVMSMEDHVWMVVGACQDGSVVLLHSSPPGVTLAGTKLDGKDKSMAETLAAKYMAKYYPHWYEKYPDISCDTTYLETAHRMRWSPKILQDAEGLRYKNAEEILMVLFGEE